MKIRTFPFLLTCLSGALPLFTNAQTSIRPDLPIKPAVRSAEIPEPLLQLPTIRGEKNLPDASEPFKYKTSSKSAIEALELIRAYKKENPDFQLDYSDNGTAAFMFGKKLFPCSSNNAQTNAEIFLVKNAPLLKILNPASELVKRISETDAKGNVHLRYDQYYEGYKIFGADLVVHANAKYVYGVNGRYVPTPKDFRPEFSLPAGTVVQKCADDLAQKAKFKVLTPKEQKLLKYSAPQVEKMLYPMKDGSMRSVYKVMIRPNLVQRWEYFADAVTGEILLSFDHTCRADGPVKASATDLMGQKVKLNLYESQGKFYFADTEREMFDAANSTLPEDVAGGIVTYDAASTMATDLTLINVSDTTQINPTAASAHHNGALSYEYYRNTHKRNSINGSGGTIISVINVGENFENAYWNGELMAYGNGERCFKPLARGLDVAGHEMTHGVISNSAGLIYMSQSGGLNESYADIFACCIDNDDWQIGEDVCNTECFSTGFLRDLSNPNQGLSQGEGGWQPAKFSDYVMNGDDVPGGNVHTNSGINNHAFFLLSVAINKDTTAKIFYHALTKYLTSSSLYIDQRRAVIKACEDLYPGNEEYVRQAGIAYDKVEVFDDGRPTRTPDDLPPVEGIGYLIIHSRDGQPGIHLFNERTKAVQKISNREVISRCSVDDEGSAAYFISKSDNNMYSIALDNADFNERQWTTDNYWTNVAVSRDGKRLACVSRYQDSSIYVFDLSTPQVTMKRFVMYHPTYTPGVTGGNPQYADAVEFDPTGEYVVYDAYTETRSSSGNSLNYWDIGIMRVWNHKQNNFGNGIVQKLFTSLPEGVNITNPTYSKNSPHIIGFDYVKSSGRNFVVTGYNTDRSTSGSVSEQDELGFPTFNTFDNKLAFSNAQGGITAINTINLRSDKINPNGASDVLVRNYRWPVWFTQGERPIPNNQPENALNQSLNLYPNPTDGRITLTSDNGTDIASLIIIDPTGKTVFLSQSSEYRTTLEADVSALSEGIYFCQIFDRSGNRTTKKMIIKK